MIIVGLVAAIPTWYVTAYLYGLWVGKKFVLPIPSLMGEADAHAESNPPRFGTVVAVLLLPLVLIFLNTGLNAASTGGILPDGTSDQSWFQILRTIGETPVALLIALLFAAFVLGRRRGIDKTALEKTLESALGPVCSVILITGAGGMFGGVLRTRASATPSPTCSATSASRSSWPASSSRRSSASRRDPRPSPSPPPRASSPRRSSRATTTRSRSRRSSWRWPADPWSRAT